MAAERALVRAAANATAVETTTSVGGWSSASPPQAQASAYVAAHAASLARQCPRVSTRRAYSSDTGDSGSGVDSSIAVTKSSDDDGLEDAESVLWPRVDLEPASSKGSTAAGGPAAAGVAKSIGVDHVAALLSDEVPFDTYRLIKTLKAHGHTTEQAEGVLEALTHIMRRSIAALNAVSVSAQDLELFKETQKRDMLLLTRQLQTMESSDLHRLRNTVTVLEDEVHKLSETLSNELTKMRSGVRLDFSLEKGRIKDEVGEVEKKIRDLDQKIAQFDQKVESRLDHLKLQILGYASTAIISIGSLTLAWLRYVS